MIIDSQEKLEKFIAVAKDATSTVYNSMIPHLTTAEEWIKTSLLGEPLYLQVGDLPPELTETVERILCMKAFIEAIPFLDVVLTPTGFGIVSTNNLAPASRERVESLRKEAAHILDDSTDELILALNKSSFREVWASGEPYPLLTSGLVWRGVELRDFAGMPSAHRTDYLELKPKIGEAEELIRQVISPEYLAELIRKRQENALTEMESKVILHLWKAVGFFLQGLEGTAENFLKRLVPIMETQPENFPTYINSAVFAARNVPVYENSKDDATFYFG